MSKFLSISRKFLFYEHDDLYLALFQIWLMFAIMCWISLFSLILNFPLSLFCHLFYSSNLTKFYNLHIFLCVTYPPLYLTEDWWSRWIHAIARSTIRHVITCYIYIIKHDFWCIFKYKWFHFHACYRTYMYFSIILLKSHYNLKIL